MKKEMRTAGRVALTGVWGALVLAALYMGSLWPAARISAGFLAMLFMIVPIIETGRGIGWSLWFVSGALAVVLLPDKLLAIGFVVFFGAYPLLKYEIEARITSALLRTVCKLLYANAILTLVYFFAAELLGTWLPVPALWVLAQPVFLVCDAFLTRLISWYIQRWKGKLFRTR